MIKKFKIQTLKGLLFLFFLGGMQFAEAQFWKKLEKRVKEGVEEAILRKTEEQTTEKTENAIDTIFEAPKKIKRKKKKRKKDKKYKNIVKNDQDKINYPQNKDITTFPNEYRFDWRYTLKMDSKAMHKNAKGSMKITYYLSTNYATFASSFDMGGKNEIGKMIMVMNPETGTNLMLMEMNGQKVKQKMPSFSGQEVDEISEEQAVKDYTIVKTDSKTILGYACQGFKVTSSDGVVNMYIAQNAPISFNNAMAGGAKFKPKGFNPNWLKEFKNGLMMEMQFISNKKEKYNVKMTCVELVQEPFSINLSEYKSFMNMGDR
jgi:hypothetical protein